MQTVYYNLMRNLVGLVVLAAVGLSAGTQSPTQDAPKTTPMKAQFTDSHEGMSIGVEPWTQASEYKQKFPKKSPFSGGVVALQMTFRNDSDESIKIDVQSIRLLLLIGEDNRQELSPLTAEDVSGHGYVVEQRKGPDTEAESFADSGGKPKPSRDKNWTEFKEACQNAAVPSSVVAAHSTLAGSGVFRFAKRMGFAAEREGVFAESGVDVDETAVVVF